MILQTATVELGPTLLTQVSVLVVLKLIRAGQLLQLNVCVCVCVWGGGGALIHSIGLDYSQVALIHSIIAKLFTNKLMVFIHAFNDFVNGYIQQGCDKLRMHNLH